MNCSTDQIQAVTKAIQFMKQNLDEELTSERLADIAGYSPYHFTRVFKEVTGASPRHYLSALRIEEGKARLIKRDSESILKTVMMIGFRSLGSFSTKFKQFVGLSPKQFRTSADKLHQFMNEYEDVEWCYSSQLRLPVIKCRIECPPDFRGLIFVGLFSRPIPDEKPIMGTAIRPEQSEYIFSKVPDGTYYVLAAAIPWSLDPRDYFLLSKNLRGKAKEPMEITEGISKEVSIKLRPPLPYDPPILINLPKLLFEKESKLEEK
ncbi:helix-turn-helix domain-containing protein [Mesobacillus subterraneus]|uniref:AraC family transcriptional regulator n=1 Tax=Mesobacillus subterraneus TaxID=285983 RepID=A0A427TX27_9BACI|nr:AraC family transcriptional regulator [Mesobacillus subterraneus]RSD29038.1 AraC family transcriptional regulator [Mesobacillus subterraneus]